MAGKKSKPGKKERCKAAWNRGQERKKLRREESERRHQANVAAGVTPWQLARAARTARRHTAETA